MGKNTVSFGGDKSPGQLCESPVASGAKYPEEERRPTIVFAKVACEGKAPRGSCPVANRSTTVDCSLSLSLPQTKYPS